MADLEVVPPAHLWVPPRSGSHGEEAIDLMRMAGRELDPEQKQSVDAMLSYGEDHRWVAFETVRIEPRQNGKALACDTPLLTANRGWTTMSDVRVGDEVFHPGGHPVAVTYVSTVELGHGCYRVTTTDGRSVVADAEHLWTVSDRARSRAVRTLTTAQLLGEGLPRGAPRANGRNEWRWQLPVQQPLKLPDVMLPLDPYLFGAWLGDGSSASGELTCHADDASHWVAAVRAAGYVPVQSTRSTGQRIGITYPAGRGRQTYSFSSKLRSLGVLGNKHVPEMYLTAGTAQRLSLLQGLLDTDGTIEPRRGQVEFCSTKLALAEAALLLARSLGWRATLRTGRATLQGRDCGPKYRVCFTPVATDGLPPFRLPRKLSRLKPADGGAGRHTVSIASIEPVASTSVRCIKVDAPDGLFLAGRGLVATHNTGGELLTVVAYDLFLGQPDRIVWTAHLLKTAMDAFNDLVQLIDGCSVMSKRVKTVVTGKGCESIILHNGAQLDFMARSEGGGRGLGGKRIVFDEALFLAGEAMGALIPTLAARSVTGDPQINYASSAAILRSDHLRALRDRGRKGGDPSLVYIEHCAPGSWDNPGCEDGPECTHMPGTAGCALDDERLWKLANHALGRRISYAYVRNERRAMPTPEQFGVERLGWHVEPAGIDQISMEAWTDCGDTESAPSSRPVFMIDASPGLKSAAIVAAMYRADGMPHVEVVAYGRGVEWLPARAASLNVHRPIEWWIDPGGPAGALLPGLREVGINPQEMTTRDMGQACSAMASLIDRRALRHLKDQVLAKALSGAGKRDLGDGLWGFSRRKSEIDICPAVGAAGALYGLSVVEPEPPPPAAPLTVDAETKSWSETGDLMSAGF